MSALPRPMLPEATTVLKAQRESADVVTLTLTAERPFQPGQFNMLYAFGVGEAPISMSGPPARTNVAIHTIKAVGAVTNALCALKKGSQVGVRGPFGTAWPMDRVVGSDVLVIAGGLGLAPVRPVIYQVLAQRARYGRLVLLVGARTPDDLLFRSELESWQMRDDITVLTTVDRAATDWKGRVGVVPALLTELFGEARFADLAKTATAFVCGPEIMMRFVLRELSRRGLDDERIYLSMERNMKCAVGFCGHCQFGPSFVCKDGPVLRYDRIRRFFWLRET